MGENTASKPIFRPSGAEAGLQAAFSSHPPLPRHIRTISEVVRYEMQLSRRQKDSQLVPNHFKIWTQPAPVVAAPRF